MNTPMAMAINAPTYKRAVSMGSSWERTGRRWTQR